MQSSQELSQALSQEQGWELRWEYCGEYDAQRSVHIDANGIVRVQRGSYHSHAPQEVRQSADEWEQLTTLLQRVVKAAPPDLPDQNTPPGHSHLMLQWQGQQYHWSWSGMLPMQPGPLQDCVAHLQQL